MAIIISLILLIVIILLVTCSWCSSKYNTWKNRNIAHEKPLPFILLLPLILLKKCSLHNRIINLYKQFKGNKVYGIYFMHKAKLFIRDPALVEKIGIRDFDNFTNHKNILTEIEQILQKSVIALRDEKWKQMRSILNKSFTGPNMPLMYELINQFCLESIDHIDKEYEMKNINNEFELEMREYFKRLSNDLITSTAFGIRTNAYENEHEEFYQIGNEMMEFKITKLFKTLLCSKYPKLMNFFKVGVWNDVEVFRNLVFETIKYREEHNIVRPDVIHYLLEARKEFENSKEALNDGDSNTFSDDELLAQCLLFFFSGFRHMSICLSFTTYELASNQEVQERLYEEIIEVQRKLKNQPLNYEILQSMKYLDMVISESLRLWPPAPITDRCCAADYHLYDNDGNFICDIKKNEVVVFPILAYHRDPDYFPNPDKFDPERFSLKNRDKIQAHTYMPFGVGQRQCIGKSFALMQVKGIIFHILSRYQLLPGRTTIQNLMNELNFFQMSSKNGFWLKLIPRRS